MTILLSSFSLSDPSKFDVFAAPFRLKLSYRTSLSQHLLSRIATERTSRDGVIGNTNFEGVRRCVRTWKRIPIASQPDHSSLDRDRHGMCAIVRTELRQNAPHVSLHGFLGD